MRVLPVESDAPGELDDQPEILSRVTGRFDRFASELHHAIRVGDRADLLRPRRGWQHHVGEVGRLGEEDILHDEVIERGHRFACVIDVRIRHRRVLTHDVHPADLAFHRGVHDLDDSQPDVRIEFGPPELLEALAGFRHVHALVVGIGDRNQARVGRTLHVILAAQRMQS